MTRKKRARKKTAKKRSTKAAAGRKTRRRKPQPAVVPPPPAVRGVAPTTARAADAEPCVDRLAAEGIVFGCAGGEIDVDTKLGVLFPNPTERERFCRCVAAVSGVPRQRIPCGAGNSLEDVIEAITCRD
jgi:hypothetical protein